MIRVTLEIHRITTYNGARPHSDRRRIADGGANLAAIPLVGNYIDRDGLPPLRVTEVRFKAGPTRDEIVHGEAVRVVCEEHVAAEVRA